ncbi:hypothetical protein F4821DRAFT_228805 [Hypoxylon rubiginosum]|uniref:Uncharacterized protein n=1 Tax=Hypoxylon rubiginosum TaxID=110542 RepID=A0ACC0DD36_9PEZI|nr:hypothetical protein F4821DRAFT_228805 [Hypoxylon rubiginosum]
MERKEKKCVSSSLAQEMDLEEYLESISASTPGVATPSHTSTTTNSTDHLHSFTAPPYTGQTFAIRERKSGRLLTLINGRIRLEHCTGEQGGWYWKCVEETGWLTFRSLVSGEYLGFQGNRRFCARRHPEGGYLLMLKQGDDLERIIIQEDNSVLLSPSEEKGTLWDFEKVQGYEPERSQKLSTSQLWRTHYLSTVVRLDAEYFT